ncbi:MAG: hypothetical protein ABR520_04540 [Mycobacteriales bacterium]
MTSRSRIRQGWLAGVATAATAAALAVPLAGTAYATHITSLALSPDTDTAAVGTCNAFTVQIAPTGSDPIDVQISQTGPAGQQVTIGFCTPPAGSGPNISSPTATTVVAAQGTTTNGSNCTSAAPATTGATTTAQCNGQFTTNNQGQLTFGVSSTRAGTMTVIAYAEEPANANNVPNVAEIQDSSTKTWTAGGAAGVTRLDCEPETDFNDEGSTHTFTCTAYGTNPSTGTQDVPIAGVSVNFDVISGPNAEETVNATCPVVTGQTGQSICSYADSTGANSPPGTDQIYAYVEQNGSPGAQAGEVFDQIAKTWVGAARSIDCSPETATNITASVHTVQCVVTDVNGSPVQGQQVQFTETGAGRFVNNQTAPVVTTNAAGIVSIETTTQLNEPGTEQITGTLGSTTGGTFTPYQQQAGVAECQSVAGTTTQPGAGGTYSYSGATTAGICFDQVSKTWTQSSPPPSTSPPATSPPATTPPANVCANPTAPGISIRPATILAGQGSTVTVTGRAGATVQLLARTSGQTYAVVRNATMPAAGVITFIVSPRYTTRVAARVCNLISVAQPIISVTARISLAATALPGCAVRFTGGTLPVKPGQVVGIYYRSSNGAVTLAMQTRTTATGTFAAQRVFLACGRVITFFSRVNADVNNLAGQSPDRTVTIRR